MILITTTEAAAALGVSRPRVAQLCSQGRIPGAYQHGGRWFIPSSKRWRGPINVIPGSRGPVASYASKR